MPVVKFDAYLIVEENAEKSEACSTNDEYHNEAKTVGEIILNEDK